VADLRQAYVSADQKFDELVGHGLNPRQPDPAVRPFLEHWIGVTRAYAAQLVELDSPKIAEDLLRRARAIQQVLSDQPPRLHGSQVDADRS
jgi:hypothetical protein